MTRISVPGPFAAARIRKSGEAGRRWIASLPGRVARLCARWAVELDAAAPPRSGDLALVLFEHRRGDACALRVAWPEHATAHEAAALRAWNGRGAVRLLAAAPDEGALLLERLAPDRSLEDLELLPAAGVAGALIRLLAIPAPPGLPRLADRLIAADTDFELLIVPGAEHLLIDCLHYVRKRGWDFLVRELMGQQPPACRPAPIPIDPELLGELFA